MVNKDIGPVLRKLVLLSLGLLLIFSAYPTTNKVIGLFGIWVIWSHADSYWSFAIAFILLVGVLVFQSLGIASIADEFSNYAFYFLIIGVIQVAGENQRDSCMFKK